MHALLELKFELRSPNNRFLSINRVGPMLADGIIEVIINRDILIANAKFT